ncbi:MAG: hypothetical protein ACRENI_03780 [Gemmatimonadaceae bacterium]
MTRSPLLSEILDLPAEDSLHEENTMDPRVRQSWEEFLNPEVTHPRLIAAR